MGIKVRKDTTNTMKDHVARKHLHEYKKYAHMNENDKIDMNNLDDWALEAVSCENNCSVDQVKNSLKTASMLTEASSTSQTIQQAANELDVDKENITDTRNVDKSEIEEILDDALSTAENVKGEEGAEYPNQMFISQAGTGKSAIVRSWARKAGINLLEIKASTMDPTDFSGIYKQVGEGEKRASKIGTGIFDDLNRPNSVLFLDEYNRAPRSVRGALIDFIQSHYLPDPSAPGGKVFMPEFLFTIATMNPPTGDYNTDALDPAEKSRFTLNVAGIDKKEFLSYLTRLYDARIEKAKTEEQKLAYEGRKGIAKALLTNDNFEFDTLEDEEKHEDDYLYQPLNVRSLTRLLELSNGTKEDFLKRWNKNVNHYKKNMAEDALSNYVDVQDKANDAIKDESESTVFKKQKSITDMLKDKFGI